MNKLAPLVILPLLYMGNCLAKTASVDVNALTSNCIETYKNKNIECLDSEINKSTKKMDTAYNSKLNEIKEASIDEIWMGDKQQKEEAINAFIKNQKRWIAYRDDYCGVALWPYQNSDHLGEAQASCEINMNQRRIEEIMLMVSVK